MARRCCSSCGSRRRPSSSARQVQLHRAAGPHFLIPIIERRAAEVNLRTQEARYSLNGKTKDNVTIGTAVSVQFRVDQMPAQTVEQSGVYRSYYILSNPIDQMESYIADALRSASRLHA